MAVGWKLEFFKTSKGATMARMDVENLSPHQLAVDPTGSDNRDSYLRYLAQDAHIKARQSVDLRRDL